MTDALKDHASMKKFDISVNDFGPKAMSFLSDMVMVNCTITELWLDNNPGKNIVSFDNW